MTVWIAKSPFRPYALGVTRSGGAFYKVIVPCTLAAAGAMAHLFQSDHAFFFASLIVSVIGCLCFGDLLFGDSKITCGKMMGLGLTLGYGLTSAYSWLQVHFEGIGIAAFAGEDNRTLCNGICLVAVVSGLLIGVGEWIERPYLLDLSFAASPRAKWFIVVAAVIVGLAFARGDLSYMGQTHDEQGRITVLGSMGAWLIPPLFGMTFAVAIYAKDRAEKWFFWTLLACEALVAIPMGRRVFIYTIFVGGLVARFCPLRRRGLTAKRVITIVLCVVGMYAASIAFLYMRFATYELDWSVSHSLLDIVDEAYYLSQTRSYAEVAAALKENTVDRGFILGFTADLVNQSESHATAKGQDIENSIMGEIPSSVWKNKPEFLGEEDLANSIFGTDYPDQANSVITAGLVDFGLIGALLYPFVAQVLMSGFFAFVSRVFSPLLATVVLLSGIYVMLNAETDFGAYTVFVRNTLLFAFILRFTSWFRPSLAGR